MTSQIAPWLTTSEYLATSGMSLRTFRRKVTTFETKKEGGKLLIASASLPSDVLAKLSLAASANVVAAPAPVRALAAPPPAAPPLFAALATTEAAQGPSRRLLVDPDQERQAQDWLRILQPFLDFCSDGTFRQRCASLRIDGRPVRTTDDMAEYVARTHSTPERSISRATIWRKKNAFESEGLAGLARKLRADKGRAKWAEQYPELARIAAATFLQPHATRQRAYDAVVREASRLGIPQHALPSYSSLCNYLATLPAAAVVLAREGEQAHKERMLPYLGRDYTRIAVNQVWVADTMIHDMLVRDDCFNGDQASVRLQLTAIMDMRSRRLVGYVWCLNGSSRSITTALIRAVRKFGLCQTFYCDNGKDFKKVARWSRPENIEALNEADELAIRSTGVLEQLGIKAVFCKVRHPQAKNVERMFGTLHGRFDAHFRHYTTGNAYRRPEAATEAAALHGKLLRMGPPEAAAQHSPLMPASMFVRMAETWIEQDYNAGHKHSGHGMDGRTPNEVFEAEFRPELARPYDPEVLHQLLWQREERRVRESAVTVGKQRYLGATDYDGQALYLANETTVYVCYDPNDPETAVVLNRDGVKIADVRREVRVGFGPESYPAIEASMVQRRGLRNMSAASIRKLQAGVVRSGHKTDVEQLYDRAQLPVAVGDSITRPLPPRPSEAQPADAPMFPHEIAARLRQMTEARR